MAELDKYMQDAEQNNLGKDVTDKAKGKVKSKTKKEAKKLGKKVTKKIADKTGLTVLKNTAAKGVKAGLKMLMKAAKKALKAALSFLLSNPVGWVILAISVTLVIALSEMKAEEAREASSQEELINGEGLTEQGMVVLMSDCPEVQRTASGTVDIDAAMETNARNVYTVFKSMGFNDYCIAGILGNLEQESQLDTTAIEAIFDENYQLGAKKQAAIADFNTYTINTVFPAYESKGITPKKQFYKGPDELYYCGIGLVQYTGPASYNLQVMAQSLNSNWYSPEFQLAYMMSDAHYREGFFTKWLTEMSTDVDSATYYFADKFVGNVKSEMDARKEFANKWYDAIAEWEIDEAFYTSVASLSANMGAMATDVKLGNAAVNCPDAMDAYDNSSMASAAVSYAYATRKEGEYNNGTTLYQRVHDNVYPGDTIYMACDRSVGCAVRWSGSDDEYPKGNTDWQYDYLIASPKWESVGMSGSVSMDDLKPGDIFILDGHTFMYVGHEIIESIHKDKAEENADSVSGSINERSPGCGNDATSIIVNHSGEDWNGRGQYEIFRCIKPDNSDTYKNAGSSAVME